MTKINLLPDVKLEYLKSQRTKYKFISISVVVSIVAIVLVGLVALHVHVAQVAQLNSKQKSIDSSLNTLQSDKNAVKVVTLQNQLQGLSSLASQKPAMSRLFGYLQELVPTNVGLNSVNVTPTTGTVTFSGTTDSYQSANAFSDILKNAQLSYQQNGQKQTMAAFNNIVFSNLGKNSSGNGATQVSFTVSLNYANQLFDASLQNVSVVVPNLTSAQINQPSVSNPNNKPFSDQAPAPPTNTNP